MDFISKFLFLFLFSFSSYAAVVIPGGSFEGGGNISGSDSYGHEWFYDTNDEGSRLIWSMPELGMSESFAGPGGEVNGFFMEFHDNALAIDMTPRQGSDDYEFRTEFVSDGLAWEASFSRLVDRIRVDFIAPENVFMNMGDYFSTAIVFDALYDPSAFTFTAGWLHIDNSGGGTTAEPSALILLLLACILLLVQFSEKIRRNKV